MDRKIAESKKGYGVEHHFQLYFSYIMAVSFICGEHREYHRTASSHRQTLSHNVVLSTLCHEQDSNSQC